MQTPQQPRPTPAQRSLDKRYILDHIPQVQHLCHAAGGHLDAFGGTGFQGCELQRHLRSDRNIARRMTHRSDEFVKVRLVQEFEAVFDTAEEVFAADEL